MFITNIFFSVLVPTTDMGSDIYLSHQTVNFIGDKKVLQVCRACFHKDGKDMLENQDKGCTTCFAFLPQGVVNNNGSWFSNNDFKYSNENEFLYQFSSATWLCQIPIIDKALELESNSEQCNESYQERLAFRDGAELLILLKSKECDSEDDCCIEKLNNVKYTDFDKEIKWEQCIRNNRGCEMCLGLGQLTWKSCHYLSDIPHPYYKQSKPIHKKSYPWNVNNRECNPEEKTKFYKITNLTIYQSELLNVNYEEGKCAKDDQCCVMFRYAEKNDKPKINHQCYDDICKLTLNRASFYVNRTLDVNDWKTIDIYIKGWNYGGRLCTNLQTYGLSILIPVMFHSMFGLLLCYNDIRKGIASYFEIVFVIFSVYPQWKVIKLWIKYGVGNINEEQLYVEKNVLDGSVSSIEPFVESCFQVYAVN